MALLATFTLAKQNQTEIWEFKQGWITIKSSRVPIKLLQACATP